MEELQAKWTFDQGGFAKALIAPTPMGQGYHLHLVKFGKMSESIVLERQRGGWRVFKSIDAAANTANGIGFLVISPAYPMSAPSRFARTCSMAAR
ncbi:plasmid replication protein RepB [Aeromonas veronii]